MSRCTCTGSESDVHVQGQRVQYMDRVIETCTWTRSEKAVYVQGQEKAAHVQGQRALYM